MDIAAEIRKQGEKAMEWVMSHREEILAAFVAKYGCGPENVVMVEETSPDGLTKTWRVGFSPMIGLSSYVYFSHIPDPSDHRSMDEVSVRRPINFTKDWPPS